ncbi:unnamed protein product [Brassica rapa subsp. narinosa]
MSSRRSRRGKEKDDDLWSRRGKEIAEETVEAEDVKELMPERLFETDRFPNKRVSTTDYLSRVRNALNNTLEMAKLIGSCFGGLFKLPAQRLKPLRFPLVGFGEVMGLPCGEFEDGYSIDFTYPIRMKSMSIRID